MSVKKLGYLGFSASNIDAWRDYATGTLGLMDAGTRDDTLFLRMDSRNWRVAVHPGAADDLLYAGFEASNRAEMLEIAERLKEMGISVEQADSKLLAQRGVIDLVSCLDPSGIKIEVYYGASELYEEPFISPTGVSGFLTQDQGLGHYVLSVEDIERSLDFYIRGLGMELSDIIDWQVNPDVKLQVNFLHCNRRHHSLALIQAPASKKLHHFMLEVGSFDDVGRAYDRVSEKNEIVMTLGRHTNDHMYSFYGVTPSGFAVEYGWGARPIESDWSVVRYDSISMWGHKFMGTGA